MAPPEPPSRLPVVPHPAIIAGPSPAVAGISETEQAPAVLSARASRGERQSASSITITITRVTRTIMVTPTMGRARVDQGRLAGGNIGDQCGARLLCRQPRIEFGRRGPLSGRVRPPAWLSHGPQSKHPADPRATGVGREGGEESTPQLLPSIGILAGSLGGRLSEIPQHEPD